jgi:hypothetical protein
MTVDQSKLKELITYLNEREWQLHDCSSSVESHLSADERDILDSYDDDLDDGGKGIVSCNLRRVELQQNTFRYAMLVAMCTFQEEVVRETCKLITQDYEAKLKRQKKGSWILKHNTILKLEGGIDLDVESDLFQRMDDLRVIRNFVVHAWGSGRSARDDKERAELEARS